MNAANPNPLESLRTELQLQKLETDRLWEEIEQLADSDYGTLRRERENLAREVGRLASELERLSRQTRERDTLVERLAEARSEKVRLIGEIERLGALVDRHRAEGELAAIDSKDLRTHGRSLVPPAETINEPADVFVWGIIDWHFRIQRPQHLSRALATLGHRVFYFSNQFVDTDEPGFRLESLAGDGLLTIVYLNVKGVPSIYVGSPKPAGAAAIFASLAEFLNWAAPTATMSLVQHPFWQPFADVLPNRRLVYDMMDHHEGFGDYPPDIVAQEQRILREADHVVTTSNFLEDVAKRKNRSVSVVRNGCEYNHFAVAPSNTYPKTPGQRIIGYYGAIATWFDVDLVEKVARRFKDVLILLVGADSVGARERLRECSNIIFTGEVRYWELPYYLYSFDVCMLPFRLTPLTLATNPVKVYEYLSAGKAVVSVTLPELRQFGSLVALAETHEDFVEWTAKALADAGGPDAVTARREFAARNTWMDRGAALRQHVLDSPHAPASIVVVTHNKLELTHACLVSLERNTAYPHTEVIVVDNASADGTPDYLRAWAARGKGRKIILNDTNRGFSEANNQGLDCSSGDFLCLLNNDTYVTPGWLGTLLRHLDRDPNLGLVGPVTNSIGGEAKIRIAYESMADMEAEARKYTTSRLGQLYQLRTAAFFCVAMRRSTFERVGKLDEAFSVGMFEDDDYCRRVEAHGMRVACAEDVFVHHHHSASFNEIAAGARLDLFNANKETYERKWGAWIPHRPRT